jgi:GTPase-associated protein 1, N-terminal domain type 2/GTPase-associated protein 1, middle domain
LYTDCRAGMGRGAGGGFQVQAQSADVDAAQAKMAVGWLLYDAPNAWIVQRRPVEEFPLGFAHASAAGYGTAQSRYVGTEATGARQGNHLADCLLTRELDLYGPTRPAQLWKSQLWRAEAWASTDCPQFDEPLPLGPLAVDAVADWLRGSTARADVLARLVSVLEDPAGRRVVITANAPDEALRWIAAATLLLPVRVALDVSFKVFCSNPVQASHRIVAVLKELNPQMVRGRADSVFVLDAEEAVSDSAEVSARARFWADLFAGAEDPYDVVDAVELADVLSGGTAQAGADALLTAWAVTVPDSPLDDPAVLFRWLSGADPKLQQEHGSAVARRILAADPSAAALRWIDTAAALGRIDVDRPAVRALLLTAEIAEVRAGGAPPTEVLGAVEASADARRDADSKLSSAIVLGSDPQVELLLRLSRRHLAELQRPPLDDRLRVFVIGWIDHPGRDCHPREWALREEILDLAHDELQDRIARGGIAEVTGAIRQLWRYFADRRGDPDDLLYCHFQAAAARGLPGQQRSARLAELMRRAEYARKPAAAIGAMQRALIEWRVLTSADSLTILRVLPDAGPVAPEIAAAAIDEIARAASRPTASALDALGVLQRRSLVPHEQRFTYLLGEDRVVLDFIQATGTARFWDDKSWYSQWLARLGEVDPTVISARLGALVRACLDLERPGLGARLLPVLPAPLPRMFVDRWSRELSGQQAIRAAVEGVFWHEDSALSGNLKSRIADLIGACGTRLGPAEHEQWYREVRDGLRTDYVKVWARLAGHDEGSRHRVLRGRGKDAR